MRPQPFQLFAAWLAVEFQNRAAIGAMVPIEPEQIEYAVRPFQAVVTQVARPGTDADERADF